MNTQVGLWIDHRRAVVVALSDGSEVISHVLSSVEKHASREGDSALKGAHESQLVPADNRRQRSLSGHLNIYYDAVIASIHGAQSVLILGPGEAKGELKSRLAHNRFPGRVVDIEAADKMTDGQIAAKVREYFANDTLH